MEHPYWNWLRQTMSPSYQHLYNMHYNYQHNGSTASNYPNLGNYYSSCAYQKTNCSPTTQPNIAPKTDDANTSWWRRTHSQNMAALGFQYENEREWIDISELPISAHLDVLRPKQNLTNQNHSTYQSCPKSLDGKNGTSRGTNSPQNKMSAIEQNKAKNRVNTIAGEKTNAIAIRDINFINDLMADDLEPVETKPFNQMIQHIEKPKEKIKTDVDEKTENVQEETLEDILGADLEPMEDLNFSKEQFDEYSIVEEKIEIIENAVLAPDENEKEEKHEKISDINLKEETGRSENLLIKLQNMPSKLFGRVYNTYKRNTDVLALNSSVRAQYNYNVIWRRRQRAVVARKIAEQEKQSYDKNWADVVLEEDKAEDDAPAKFKCPHCKYKTDWKNNMTKHVTSKHTSHSDIQWFHCAHCTYKGKTREYLSTHLRNHHQRNIVWHNCTKCDFKCKQKMWLKYHILSFHTAPEDVKWFKCKQCPYKAKFKQYLKHHVSTNHGPTKLYPCPECDFTTTSQKGTRTHYQAEHAADDELTWYKCKKCPFKERNRDRIKSHLKYFHAEADMKNYELIKGKSKKFSAQEGCL